MWIARLTPDATRTGYAPGIIAVAIIVAPQSRSSAQSIGGIGVQQIEPAQLSQHVEPIAAGPTRHEQSTTFAIA